MAWPSRAIEYWLSGADAKTQGRDIFDRHMVLKSKPIGIPFEEVNHNTDTWTSKVTRRVLIPPFAVSGDTLEWYMNLRHSAATAYARMVESGGTTGPEVARAGTGFGIVGLSLTIPDGTWAGSVMAFELQLRNGGAGTTYAHTSGLAGNFRVVD